MIEKKFVVRYNEAKWIILSSCLNVIPSYYAYKYRLLNESIIMAIMTILSVNYWTDYDNLMKRKLDVMWTRVVFFVVFNNYRKYINNNNDKLLCMLSLFGILYGYRMSCKKFDGKKKTWFLYHMLFHMIAAFSISFVFNRTYKYKNYKKIENIIV